MIRAQQESPSRRRITFTLGVLGVLLLGLACSSRPELEGGNSDDNSDVDKETETEAGANDNPPNLIDIGDASTGADGSVAANAVCGNGELEIGEVCDDGAEEDGDGCSADCSTQDLDFVCEVPGEPCVDTVTCGSGVLEGDEVCDDGNAEGGDGCSSDCSTVEQGYVCSRPGKECVAVPICGNGLRERGEDCDDGEATPEDGDGCSAECLLEPAYFCPVPGSACVALVCGNGTRTPDEECDDGQEPSLDGDGCSSTCELEEGYYCSGTNCQPACGDGLLRGAEACDDANRSSGDGCSAACLAEPTYTCEGEPSACDNDVCGNDVVDLGEICDPPGVDGCEPGCKTFNPYSGVDAECGNEILELGETCEGATLPFTGCLEDCVADTGFVCPRSGECFREPACGDSIVQTGEACDVGSMGSAACQDCTVQPGWFCYGPGPSVCEQSICGDGLRQLDEECDDENPTDADGCSSCEVDLGWVCPTAGQDCIARCGDGLVRGVEVCDDENTDDGDGCSSTCRIEPGSFCENTPCEDGEEPAATNCGNGIVEGSEGCDDGANDLPFDGCYACKKDPVCEGGNCVSTCGDGQRFADEECDDGNTDNGDGCSSACTEEEGFSCVDFSGTPPDTLELPVIARDFVGVNRQASGATPGTWAEWLSSTSFHPDFNAQFGAAMRAMVKDTLGPDKKPQWNWVPYATEMTKPPAADTSTEMPPTNLTQCSCGTSLDDTPPACTCSDTTVCYCDNPAARRWSTQSGVRRPTFSVPSRFAQWYSNDPADNVVLGTSVTLTRDVALGTYAFDSAISAQNGGKDYMDPFGAGGQVEAGNETMAATCSPSRNVSWTTETHFWFEYAGGETFDFAGDDDTWVFVDGKLAIDLGGLHGALTGSFTLDADTDGGGADTADGSGSFTTAGVATTTQYPASGTLSLGLTVGGVYEVVMFQAERNQCGSNFKVTLKDFNKPKSVCTSVCGDGIVVGAEACDDGDDNEDDAYGKCNTSCSEKLYCGDGIHTETEESCDNGLNIDTYANEEPGACAPGCTLPGECADGIVQSAFEVCDQGVQNSNTSYGSGSCNESCELGGYCGDGIWQAEHEACDSGVGNTSYQAAPGGCGYDCQEAPHCGDGFRNGPELCDLGALNGEPGEACDATCQLVGYCGDGIPQSPDEDCDFGVFASDAYGACNESCEWGALCGDGTHDAPIEECDEGDSNGNDYDGCTEDCTFGPRCGDGELQEAEDEQCDNGFNEDAYEYDEDSCAPSCQRPPHCGDGTLAAGFELCDLGDDNSDTAYEGCKLDCTWGPYCGDGSEDASEDCDEGKDNTVYAAKAGGCGYDCKPAPYCGDGERNGPEACDLGKSKNTGERGGCNSDCTLAPRCGDNKVQKGEACDDGPVGSLACSADCKNRAIR